MKKHVNKSTSVQKYSGRVFLPIASYTAITDTEEYNCMGSGLLIRDREKYVRYGVRLIDQGKVHIAGSQIY